MVRATWPKSPEYRAAFLERRFLTSQMARITPRAPSMRPGKKPAAKDLPSKEDLDSGRGSAELEVAEADAGLVGEEVGSGAAEEGASLEAIHMPLLQV